MQKEDDFYSGLSQKNNNGSKEEPLGAWYNFILKPPFVIIGGIILVLTTNYSKIFDFISNDYNGDGLLWLLLFIMSIVAGIRAYQSFYLAKIDYSNLKRYKRDNLTFLAIFIFLSVTLLTFFYNKIIFLYIIYAVITALATINFWDLFLIRLKKQEDEFDYICEKRIQLINATVFSIITVLLISIVLIRTFLDNAIWLYMLLTSVICILLILNMFHSRKLTYIPKIILSNEKENNNSPDFKKLKICRMNKADTDRIIIGIIEEFRYVFEYIFNTKDNAALKRILRSLLVSGFGFGALGYMSFYSIKHSDNNTEVGWIKIDTRHKCWIYLGLEFISLPVVIARQFGIRKLPKIYKRAKSIVMSQPTINNGEFELTYFVIHEQHRKNKYGISAINLLVNALFHSKTNNIDAHKLVCLIRESNVASLSLFRKAGFTEYQPEIEHEEPSEIQQTQGKGIFFQYSNNND